MISNANVAELSTFSLRCVECEALYPAVETGCPPRYRCDCGGVFDVETVVRLPVQAALPAGAAWRQLFDERASRPPTWPISTDELGTGEKLICAPPDGRKVTSLRLHLAPMRPAHLSAIPARHDR